MSAGVGRRADLRPWATARAPRGRHALVAGIAEAGRLVTRDLGDVKPGCAFHYSGVLLPDFSDLFAGGAANQGTFFENRVFDDRAACGNKAILPEHHTVVQCRPVSDQTPITNEPCVTYDTMRDRHVIADLGVGVGM